MLAVLILSWVSFLFPLLIAIKCLDRTLDSNPIDAQGYRHIINALVYIIIIEQVRYYLPSYPFLNVGLDICKLVVILNHSCVCNWNNFVTQTIPMDTSVFESYSVNTIFTYLLPYDTILPSDMTPFHYWLLNLDTVSGNSTTSTPTSWQPPMVQSTYPNRALYMIAPTTKKGNHRAQPVPDRSYPALHENITQENNYIGLKEPLSYEAYAHHFSNATDKELVFPTGVDEAAQFAPELTSYHQYAKEIIDEVFVDGKYRQSRSSKYNPVNAFRRIVNSNRALQKRTTSSTSARNR